ncbi:MAG: trigger factor [Chitinophagales bacterium]|nr:trigger factor [Chitinophagales bacterium]
MTVTHEKQEALRSKIQVNLKIEDYEPKVKKEIKKLAKSVQVKGFRPGMVPYDMVKKMYGNSVLAEELNNLLNDEVYKFIDENKLEIIASPIPADGQKLSVDINNLQDIDFAYEVGHAPEVSLAYIEGAPIFTKYKIAADDAMIDEEVMRIRKRFSTYEYPDTIGETDILTVSLEELNADGSVKEGGINTVSSIMVDLLKEEARKVVLSLKKTESFEYDVFELMDRDREGIAKNILNLSDLSKVEEIGHRFKLTINNITRSVPAEINEEFFVKVYGENGPKTEAEMRENIATDLASYFDGRTDTVLINDLYKGVMENIEFPLPEDFLKRWIKLTNEKPITEEELEKDFPNFAKSLRWSLIQRKLVAQQNIEVTEDEVKERVRMNVVQQLYGYGLRNIGDEWVQEFMNKQLADKKVISQTREQLLEDKVLGYIKSKVKLNETPISLDDFKALLEQQQPQ